MRKLSLLMLWLSLSGCPENREEPCEAAYDHLVTIAHQVKDSSVRLRFVTACVEAWDEGRHECIMAATDATSAQACRAGRVPPG